jgi:hypothetical protein
VSILGLTAIVDRLKRFCQEWVNVTAAFPPMNSIYRMWLRVAAERKSVR